MNTYLAAQVMVARLLVVGFDEQTHMKEPASNQNTHYQIKREIVDEVNATEINTETQAELLVNNSEFIRHAALRKINDIQMFVVL